MSRNDTNLEPASRRPVFGEGPGHRGVLPRDPGGDRSGDHRPPLAAAGQRRWSSREPLRPDHPMGDGPVLRSERGSLTVELFLVIPVVVLVLVGGLQLVGVSRSRLELAGAARDWARVAASCPAPPRAVAASLAALPPQISRRRSE